MKRYGKTGLVPTLHLSLLVLSILLFFAVSSSPLLGTLGFESANLLVVCLGPLLCLVAALNKKVGFANIFRRELAWLVITCLLYAGLLFANGFHITSCSQGIGILPFIIIAVPPLLLNVSIGTVIAAIINNQLAKIVLVFTGYLAYYLAIGYLWWQEASFRVFTHASFLMSSDLLHGDKLSPAVVGYRTATLLLALAIILFGINFLKSTGPKVFEKRYRSWQGALAVVLALVVAHVMIAVESYKELGKSRSDLKKDYRLLTSYQNLQVFADPLKTSIHEAETVLKEARFYQARIAQRLGELSSKPIVIWLHSSDVDKFLYTGAKNVHFALPRHREIHIAGYGFPHRVLGHELAHIDVGDFTTTVMGLPGSNWLIPNLALTEGLAMALSQELNLEHGLTLLEQARALYQADFLINLDEFFSNNLLFLKTNHHIGYIYSGAMIDFFLMGLNASEQQVKLRSLITGGSMTRMFTDEQEFFHAKRAFLAELAKPIGVDAISWARRSFSQSSILVADCTEHGRKEKMKLQELAVNQNITDYGRVLASLSVPDQKVICDSAIDAALTSLRFHFALGLIDIRSKLLADENRGYIEALAFKKLDALIGMDDLKASKQVLDNMDDAYFLPKERRLLVILRIFLRDYADGSNQPSLKRAAVRFLFSRPTESYKLADFSYFYGRNREALDLGNLELLLSRYILARLYMHQGQYVQARRLITELVEHQEQLPDLIARETMVMSAKTNMHLGDYVAAIATLEHLRETSMSAGEKLEISDMIERSKFDLNYDPRSHPAAE